MHTRDTEVVATAEPSTEVLPEASLAESSVTTVEPSAQEADLALLVEALLITSSRPLTAQRLAEGLGLVPREDADTAAPTTDNAAPEVVTKPRKRPAKKGTGPSPLDRITNAIAALNKVYAQSGRAFRIEAMSGGYRFMTLPKFGAAIAQLQGATATTKLSRAAVETLAIIAYKQPITRGKLEAVRGCACGEVLKSLLERRLITIAGRAEELGRPLLYATSKAFLDTFGLASLRDLPTSGDLKS